MLLSFCPYVGTWRFLWWCILILWHVYFRDVWLLSAATVEEFYICMLFEFLCENVASISWIYALFACFIALIEIWRYRNNHSQISSYLLVGRILNFHCLLHLNYGGLWKNKLLFVFHQVIYSFFRHQNFVWVSFCRKSDKDLI